ncbi:MAG: LPS export ABC transporter periplasmic protein LptC [Candidatus Omnitrophota bacterium]
MISLFLILIMIICPACLAEEEKKAEQKIDGFSLVQYDDGGGKKWEMNGRSAELEGDKVKIDAVSLLSSNNQTFLKLKAKEGEFDKVEKIVYLQNNVVMKSSDGTMLTTDSLNWDAGTKNVFTEDPVNIKKSDFEVSGKGAQVDLENKIAELREDVTANIESLPSGYSRSGVDPSALSETGDLRTTITCDGPLEINYNKNKAVFLNNVKIEDIQGNILADRIDVYFNKGTKRIRCVVARGNVKIINGENVTYSEKAIYLVEEGRVVLPNRPKLVIQNERSE